MRVDLPIATVFPGVINRMTSGYLLRDVINKVNGIHFTSSDEIHALGHLHESARTLTQRLPDKQNDSPVTLTRSATLTTRPVPLPGSMKAVTLTPSLSLAEERGPGPSSPANAPRPPPPSPRPANA